MLALKQYRQKSKGLSDLLHYAAVVDDGVVLGKDGCLMAGWYYRGADVGSSTAEERNVISARINAALARRGNGWMVHIDAVRVAARNYPGPEQCHFPDPVSALIDAERRGQFQAEGAHFETVYGLVVTYLPPPARVNQFAELMFEDTRPVEQKQNSLGGKLLDYFKGRLAEIEDHLGAVLKLQRMRGVPYVDEAGATHTEDQLLGYLNYCVSGEYHPINLPPCPMYLDAVLGGQEVWGGVIPRIGEKYLGVVAIEGLPQESYPGILTSLDQMATQYRWSTRFIFLDAVDAITQLKAYRRRWRQKIVGFGEQIFKTGKGVVDQDALAMAAETEAAIGEAASGLVSFGYYTSVLVLMDEDRDTLEEDLREARRQIQNLGFASRVETINTMEAWLGSLPGNGVANVRRPLLHTMNLADLIPVSAIWAGHEFNPCPFYPPEAPALSHAATDGATPFRLNLHVGDVGHTVVFGPTGSGKSTLLGFIAAQFRRYEDATIFAFDKGNSLYTLSQACGGRHYEIAKELAFCPLGQLESDGDLAWAGEWIATLIALQGVTVMPRHRNEIHRVLGLMRHDSSGRSLTDLVTSLQDKELREALEHYTLSGGVGHLLDSRADQLSLTESRFHVFEMEELMILGDRNVIPVLLYLFHQIEQQLEGQPALLILDEAWLMLGHPVFREKIREWLKVLRKANCAVVLATQSLSDAVRSGILDVLQESCPVKIFLPNEEAQNRGGSGVLGPRDVYEIFGLNDRQIEILANAVKKRQYYYLSPEGRRLFELNLGPVARCFTCVSDRETITALKQIVATHGEEWPWAWLRQNGVDYEMHRQNTR